MMAKCSIALRTFFFAGIVASGVQSQPVTFVELSFFNQSSGMFEGPMFDLSNQTVVSMLGEHLNQSACDCTPSGYSGMSFDSDMGKIASYGNTTYVGCANHDMDGEMLTATNSTYCYVLGGTGCADATPSILGDKDVSFTIAAYRECNPLTEKGGCLGFGLWCWD